MRMNRETWKGKKENKTNKKKKLRTPKLTT
jgi:hypothetical protein